MLNRGKVIGQTVGNEIVRVEFCKVGHVGWVCVIGVDSDVIIAVRSLRLVPHAKRLYCVVDEVTELNRSRYIGYMYVRFLRNCTTIEPCTIDSPVMLLNATQIAHTIKEFSSYY